MPWQTIKDLSEHHDLEGLIGDPAPAVELSRQILRSIVYIDQDGYSPEINQRMLELLTCAEKHDHRQLLTHLQTIYLLAEHTVKLLDENQLFLDAWAGDTETHDVKVAYQELVTAKNDLHAYLENLCRKYLHKDSSTSD